MHVPFLQVPLGGMHPASAVQFDWAASHRLVVGLHFCPEGQPLWVQSCLLAGSHKPVEGLHVSPDAHPVWVQFVLVSHCFVVGLHTCPGGQPVWEQSCALAGTHCCLRLSQASPAGQSSFDWHLLR